MTSNTQTAYVLALDFDLLPDSLRADAAGRLAADVRRMGHLTTGFLGTPALTRDAERQRISRRRVHASPQRAVSVVAVRGEAGSDDDLGAVGRPEAGQHLPGRRR